MIAAVSPQALRLAGLRTVRVWQIGRAFATKLCWLVLACRHSIFMSDHYSEAWQFPAIIHLWHTILFDIFMVGRNVDKKGVGYNRHDVAFLPEIARQTGTLTTRCLARLVFLGGVFAVVFRWLTETPNSGVQLN